MQCSYEHYSSGHLARCTSLVHYQCVCIYHRALQYMPCITVHEGTFLMPYYTSYFAFIDKNNI